MDDVDNTKARKTRKKKRPQDAWNERNYTPISYLIPHELAENYKIICNAKTSTYRSQMIDLLNRFVNENRDLIEVKKQEVDKDQISLDDIAKTKESESNEKEINTTVIE